MTSGVPAGAEFGIGGTGDAGGSRVRKLEVTVTADHGDDAGTIRLPEASNARVRQTDFGTEVRAPVTNSLDAELSSITDVFAILRDTSGQIVGGFHGYPESDIQPHGRAAVQLGGLDELRSAERADVYVDGETS